MLLTGSDSLHTLFLQPELWHKQSFSSRVSRQDKIGVLPLSQIEILFLRMLGYWMYQGWHPCHLWYLGHWLYFPKGAVADTRLVGVLWLCPVHVLSIQSPTRAQAVQAWLPAKGQELLCWQVRSGLWFCLPGLCGEWWNLRCEVLPSQECRLWEMVLNEVSLKNTQLFWYFSENKCFNELSVLFKFCQLITKINRRSLEGNSQKKKFSFFL